MREQTKLFNNTTGLVIAGIVAVAVVLLNIQGRVWWCQAGDYTPWAFNIWTSHNSQHVIDPYTFTHILHGILEFWLIALVFWKLPLAWRFVLAVLIESAWEVGENTSFVINKYREETISLDYFGDSIVNSLADIVSCGLGFGFAYLARFWRSLIFFVLTEAVLIFTIRDSLIINLVMLISPVEAVKVAIKTWQMG